MTAAATTTASTPARTRSDVDEHPTLAHPVHPGPGRQPDDQERGGLGGGQQAHLPLGRGELLHRVDGQRQAGQLRAELAERVAGPQAAEVGVVHEGLAHRTAATLETP